MNNEQNYSFILHETNKYFFKIHSLEHFEKNVTIHEFIELMNNLFVLS